MTARQGHIAEKVPLGRRRKQQARRQPRSHRQILILLCGLLLIIQILLPAMMIILIAGMAPTVVAYFVDPEKRKRGTHGLAVMNFAGVLPILTQLWMLGATRTAAMTMLSEPLNWLLMYGAAGLAVFLMTMLPPFVAQVLEVGAKQQAARLLSQQEKLIEQWGRGVAGAGPTPGEAKANDDDGSAPAAAPPS